MFSLPDIVAMNEAAAEAAFSRQHEKQCESPHNHNCEVCEWHGVEKPADYGYPWFDIFSDDSKGTVFLCEQHDGYTGDPIEGYFTCAECERVFISNYTWEYYSRYVEGLGELCLPCALKAFVADPQNWIDPREVTEVVMDPDVNAIYEDGILNLAKVPHLVAVKMCITSTLHFVGNLEFDSMTGEMLATIMTTHSAGVGENAMSGILSSLTEQGYSKCILIMDAVYQFACSIGVYVHAEEHSAISDTTESLPLPVAA